MKSASVTLIALFVGTILAACNPQTPAPSKIPIVAGTLETAEAYLKRGDQYADIRDYEHAIQDYSQAIRLKPDYAEAYNNRGYARYYNGKPGLEQAIADYSQAIRLRPNYAYAFNNRGAAYMASGYPDEALLDFNRALQLQPDFPQALGNRSNVYFRMGRLDLALPDLFRAGSSTPVFLAVSLLALVIALGAAGAYQVARRRRRKTH